MELREVTLMSVGSNTILRTGSQVPTAAVAAGLEFCVHINANSTESRRYSSYNATKSLAPGLETFETKAPPTYVEVWFKPKINSASKDVDAFQPEAGVSENNNGVVRVNLWITEARSERNFWLSTSAIAPERGPGPRFCRLLRRLRLLLLLLEVSMMVGDDESLK